MRVTRLFFTLPMCILALLSVSCTKETERELPAASKKIYTIKAVMGDQAKATVADDGHATWSAGDKIAVYDAIGAKFCEFTTASGDGVFTFAGDPEAEYQFTLAFYPSTIMDGTESIKLPASYSAEDVQRASFFPLRGEVEDGTVHLKHLGALLKYHVQGIPADATLLELSSPTVSLSGVFPIEGSGLDDGWVNAEGEDVEGHDDVEFKSAPSALEIHSRPGDGTIRIPLTPGQKKNLTLYIPLPVGAYSCTMKVKNGETTLFEKSTQTLKDIKRAKIITIQPFKLGFGGGVGTPDNPYLISEPQHLAELSQSSEDKDLMASSYLQTADIDLSGTGLTPCGRESVPFTGSYDGAGHKISNLAITVSGNGAGLFGKIAGGNVKDLDFIGARVSASGQNAGVVAGSLAGGSISGCRVDAGSEVIAGGKAAGSIAGTVESGVVRECASHASVQANEFAGGLVGCLVPRAGEKALVINGIFEPVFINGKLAGATVRTSSADACMGGICGDAKPASAEAWAAIVNCYAYPLELRSTQEALTKVNYMGGILGRMGGPNANVFNCISPITYSNLVVGDKRVNAGNQSVYNTSSCIVGYVTASGCSVRKAYSKNTWPGCYRLVSGTSITHSDISLRMGDSNMRGYHDVVYATNHPVTGPDRYTQADGGILAALNAGAQEWNASQEAEATALAWSFDPCLGYPKPAGVDFEPMITRKVTIFGDSISTYQGYVFSTDEKQMSKFYPDMDNFEKFKDEMVLNEQDTWWWHIIYDYLPNTRLEVCNSWGGTTTSYFTENVTNQYGTAKPSASTNVNSLQGRNLTYGLGSPDILVYYGGRNDFGFIGNNTSVLLGSFTDESLQEAYDASPAFFNNYSQGTVSILKDFHSKNPQAKILVLLHDMMNDDYEDAATAISAFLTGKGFDIRFVSFHERGTTNATNYVIGMKKENGSHPNKESCANMAAYVMNQVGLWLEE